MSNVLPQLARKKVWRMYRARFLLAGSVVGLVVAALAAVALVPSYVVLQASGLGPPAEQTISAATASQDRMAILENQSLLTALSPLVSATTSRAQLIAAALSLRPADIRVEHITLTSGNPGTMILAGSATNISAIETYRKTLGSDSSFSSVSVPVGDLAGTQNGQFSITLLGNF